MAIKGEDFPYIGEWAELRKNYLLEEKPEDYDELENKRFGELVERQMERDGVDEQLKITKPLEWVGLVNNIRSQVREILTYELCS